MKQVYERTHEFKLLWTQGLLMDCPMGDALKTCPLNHYRNIPLQDRFAPTMTMDEHQLDAIISHHIRCMNERGGYHCGNVDNKYADLAVT